MITPSHPPSRHFLSVGRQVAFLLRASIGPDPGKQIGCLCQALQSAYLVDVSHHPRVGRVGADCLSQNGTQAPLPHYDLVTSTLHVISLQTHCCARCTLLSISQVILWSCLRLPTAPAICCNVSQNLLSPSPRIHLTPMSYTPSHSTSITVYDSPRFWQGGSKRWATALAHGAQVLQHRTLLPK